MMVKTKFFVLVLVLMFFPVFLQENTDEGGCEMVAKVNLGREGKFILVVLNDSIISVDENNPKFEWIALKNIDMDTSKNVDTNYAGLLLYARYLGLKPVVGLLEKQKVEV